MVEIDKNKEISRDLILKVVRVLRFVHINWFYDLKIDFQLPDNKIPNLLHGLVRNGFLVISEDITRSRIVSLTKKGFERSEAFFATDTKFRNSGSIWKSRGISDLHTFIMFKFLVNYFLFFDKEIEVIKTFKDNRSKIISPSVQNKQFYIIPDVTVITKSSYDLVEADTGIETSFDLYLKILKYLFIMSQNYLYLGEKQFNIYFSFARKDRENYMLLADGNYEHKGSIYKLFDKYTNPIQINNIGNLNISTKDIVELFESQKITIYAGNVNAPLSNFKKVDFVNNLFKVNNWNRLSKPV